MDENEIEAMERAAQRRDMERLHRELEDVRSAPMLGEVDTNCYMPGELDTLESLSEELSVYIAQQQLPVMCALELIIELQEQEPRSEKVKNQIEYLQRFINRWEVAKQ